MWIRELLVQKEDLPTPQIPMDHVLVPSDSPRQPLTLVPLTMPDADLYPWASVLTLPWPSPVPREVLNAQGWGCLHLISAWESGIELVLPHPLSTVTSGSHFSQFPCLVAGSALGMPLPIQVDLTCS